MGSLHRAGSAPVDSVVAPSTTGRELIPLSQRLPPDMLEQVAPRRLSGRRCSTRCGNGARSARRRPEFVRSQFLDHGVRRSGELSGRSRRSWSVGPRTRAANSELWSAASSEESVAPDFYRHGNWETGEGIRVSNTTLARELSMKSTRGIQINVGTLIAMTILEPVGPPRPTRRRDGSILMSARRGGAYLAGSWVEPTSTASTLTHCRRRRRRRWSRAKGDLQIILGCFGTWERATAKGDLQIILPTDKGDLQIILRRR